METAIKDKDVQGLKYFAKLLPLLDRLREKGCERDTAGNRQLVYDNYVKAVLLYMWNPLIGSMRTFQKVIALPKVFKALGIRRFSLGSFSEVPAGFDPEHLKAIVEELVGEQDVIHHLHKPDNTRAKLRVKEALREKLTAKKHGTKRSK